mgnify:FL=1
MDRLAAASLLRDLVMVQPSIPPLPLDKSPREISGMFDDIAGRYDVLNRLLSAGRDRVWRIRAVEALELQGSETVLDLCTGTADLALALTSFKRHAARVVGVDFSGEMLRQGYTKIRRVRSEGSINLLRGDAEQIPLCDGVVDGVSIGFGIRNVAKPQKVLAEIRRVLRPGGRLVILEFGEPKLAAVRAAYLWYFRRVLPLVGKMVSRHRSAYTYLPASVGAFHNPPAFCGLLEQIGFTHVQVNPLTFGIVYLYSALRD